MKGTAKPGLPMLTIQVLHRTGNEYGRKEHHGTEMQTGLGQGFVKSLNVRATDLVLRIAETFPETSITLTRVCLMG